MLEIIVLSGIGKGNFSAICFENLKFAKKPVLSVLDIYLAAKRASNRQPFSVAAGQSGCDSGCVCWER